MRLFEECPYVTPCGWCSRQGKPCEAEEKKKIIVANGRKKAAVEESCATCAYGGRPSYKSPCSECANMSKYEKGVD